MIRILSVIVWFAGVLFAGGGEPQILGTANHRFPIDTVFQFADNDTTIVALTSGKTVTFLDAKTGLPKGQAVLPVEGVIQAKLLPDGKRALLIHRDAGKSSVCGVWDLKSAKRLAEFQITGGAGEITFSPHSEYAFLISGGAYLPNRDRFPLEKDNELREITMSLLVNLATGKITELPEMRHARPGHILRPQFSQDGKSIVLAVGDERNVRVDCFDVPSGKSRWKQSLECSYPVRAMLIGDTWIIRSHEQKKAFLVPDGKETAMPGLGMLFDNLGAAKMSRDHRRIVCVAQGERYDPFDPQLCVFDNYGKRMVDMIELPQSVLSQFIVSSDGRKVLFYGHGIRLFDLGVREWAWGVDGADGHAAAVQQVRFSTNGRHLFSQDTASPNLTIWNLSDSKPLKTWRFHTWQYHERQLGGEIESRPVPPLKFDVSLDGKRLVVADQKLMTQVLLRLIDVETTKYVESVLCPNDHEQSRLVGVAFPRDGAGFATATQHHDPRGTKVSISRYSTTTNSWTAMRTLDVEWGGSRVEGAGNRIIHANRCFDFYTGREVFSLQAESIPMAFTASNGQIALGTECKKGTYAATGIKVWETTSGLPVKNLEWEYALQPGAGDRKIDDRCYSWPRIAALSLSGRIAVTVDLLGVRLWDIATGRMYHKYQHEQPQTMHSDRSWMVGEPAPVGPATAVAFSPDGKKIALGMPNGTVELWDVPSAKSLAAKDVDAKLLWQQLGDSDASKAWKAAWTLMELGDVAVRTVAENIPPSVRPKEIDVRNLVNDLDANEFRKREAARKQLIAVSDMIAEDLETISKGKLSAEQQQWVARIREQIPMDDRPLSVGWATVNRAFAVLEQIANPSAIAHLRRLAAGDSGAWSVRLARRALSRIESRIAGQ
jgi:WD40 repeat protein